MRIATVEAIPYALPFERPYVTARGTLTRREMVLLRLRDEEGRTGLGEAVPLSLRGGAGLREVVDELDRLAELLPTDEEGLRAATGLSAPARCAVETALLDLGARQPVPTAASRRFFGAGPTEGRLGRDGETGVRCNATLVAGEPAAVAEEALSWSAHGFETFKLKLGAGGDVAQVRAVRAALGAAARIRVDANAAWDLATAKRLLAELAPFDVELAEQPVANLEEMAELAAAVPAVPLAADESVAEVAEARRAAQLGACRYTGVKLSKVGGPTEALAIAAVLPAFLSSALDGPVGIAMAAHVALAADAAAGAGGGRLAHGLATQRLFAASVARVECELRDAALRPPPGPGLGVEIDEEALRAHRLDRD